MLVHEWGPRSDCVGTYGAIFVRREVEFSQYCIDFHRNEKTKARVKFVLHSTYQQNVPFFRTHAVPCHDMRLGMISSVLGQGGRKQV